MTEGRVDGRARLFTFGHGTLGTAQLCELLHAAGVEAVVDVRSAPGSRRHPHVARDAMAVWLPEAGFDYRWAPDLGGWRKPRSGSTNMGLRNGSFRGYADYMEGASFAEALDGLLDQAATKPTAAMCSESLWWRCHRRLVADAAVLVHGAQVVHLGHDARLSPHRVTDAATLINGRLGYPPPEPTLPGI